MYVLEKVPFDEICHRLVMRRGVIYIIDSEFVDELLDRLVLLFCYGQDAYRQPRLGIFPIRLVYLARTIHRVTCFV